MSKSKNFPKVMIDLDSDFAAIKLAPGIEAKSYIKDGVLFSEDAKGKIIEIQILNIRSNQKPKSKKTKRAV